MKTHLTKPDTKIEWEDKLYDYLNILLGVKVNATIKKWIEAHDKVILDSFRRKVEEEVRKVIYPMWKVEDKMTIEELQKKQWKALEDVLAKLKTLK